MRALNDIGVMSSLESFSESSTIRRFIAALAFAAIALVDGCNPSINSQKDVTECMHRFSAPCSPEGQAKVRDCAMASEFDRSLYDVRVTLGQLCIGGCVLDPDNGSTPGESPDLDVIQN